jgi:hypothetical protein
MAGPTRRQRIPAADSPSGLAFTDKDEAVTDWPTIREWVLERDRHVCQICLIRAATDVDHIWPRRLGGEDHVDNLRAACGPCNKVKGDRVEIGEAGHWDLMRAVRALEMKIAEMEAEKEVFENALLASQLAEPVLEVEFVLRTNGANLVERADRLRARGQRQAACAEKIAQMRLLFESAPDAEVIQFPLREPGPDEAA